MSILFAKNIISHIKEKDEKYFLSEIYAKY